MHASRSLDLDSLAQEILLDAWLNHRPVTGKMIHDRYINLWHASRAHQRALERALAAEPFLDTEDDSAPSERRELISEVLQRAALTPIELQALILVYFVGKSYADAAADLNWSESQFKVTFGVVNDKLKKAGRLVQAEREAGK